MLSKLILLSLVLAGFAASSAIAQPDGPKVPQTAVFDKTFCFRQINHAASVIALPDGGFAAAGHTNAKGAGSSDAWVVRLDAAGGLLWEKAYGGQLDDAAHGIAALPDGGFIVAGSFHSMDRNKGDGWLLRLDAKGEVLWEKTYGSKLAAFASVAALPDGGFIAAGRLHDKPASYQKSMAWVLRLDANGNILWEQSFRRQETLNASTAARLSDGSFAVAANCTSTTRMNAAFTSSGSQPAELHFRSRPSVIWMTAQSNRSRLWKTVASLSPDGPMQRLAAKLMPGSCASAPTGSYFGKKGSATS